MGEGLRNQAYSVVEPKVLVPLFSCAAGGEGSQWCTRPELNHQTKGPRSFHGKGEQREVTLVSSGQRRKRHTVARKSMLKHEHM